jgi:hypothetical protein
LCGPYFRPPAHRLEPRHVDTDDQGIDRQEGFVEVKIASTQMTSSWASFFSSSNLSKGQFADSTARQEYRRYCCHRHHHLLLLLQACHHHPGTNGRPVVPHQWQSPWLSWEEHLLNVSRLRQTIVV